MVPGGQDTGEDGRPINRPSSVLDNQTGQFVQSPAGQRQAATEQRTVGGIYTDAKGNRAKWDGKNFVPA